MIKVYDGAGNPMDPAQVAEYAARHGIKAPPGPPESPAYARWLRVVAAHVKAERVRQAKERRATPEHKAAVLKRQRTREVNEAVAARWADELPEVALLARGQAVSMSAAARRERLAKRYPAFLCARCGREERPADYVDPGQAADLARRRCCWLCTAGEWLAPIAGHPASEVRDGVVWLGGVAVGLLAAQPGPHEEEGDAHDGGGGHRVAPVR